MNLGSKHFQNMSVFSNQKPLDEQILVLLEIGGRKKFLVRDWFTLPLKGHCFASVVFYILSYQTKPLHNWFRRLDSTNGITEKEYHLMKIHLRIVSRLLDEKTLGEV